MTKAGLVLGVFCTVGMLIAMVPFPGWINWFNLPLSFISSGLSAVGTLLKLDEPKKRNIGIAGAILASVCIVFGGFRWVMGGFFL